jgi:transcriptional regulator with XRE-family HTH domain
LKYRIREIRIEKGLTTYELAEKAGITRMALWRIETNQSDAKASTLQNIADVLGVGIEELFLRDEG